MIIQRFGRNDLGRDFVVGDIHGHFRLLEKELHRISFNPMRDRMFSVGDLVDRGPDSIEAIDWIAKPWFLAVRGNHEQMAIGVAAGRHSQDNYAANGGGWFLQLPPEHQKLIAKVFDVLPYAIEVQTRKGRVGIVHADIAGDSWDEFTTALELASSNNQRHRLHEICLWSRSRIQAAQAGYKTAPIHDLHELIVGHTPLIEPIYLENVRYIDTGAFRTGKLTVIEL